jgi:hypothetical protein
MPAPNLSQNVQEIPLKIVGGTHYGRYPKISLEETWNMIVSDSALVDYAGYSNVASLASNLLGRGLYASSIANMMFAVIGNQFFSISNTLQVTFISTISTSSGDVFISENNGDQIAFTDNVNIYVYNYTTFVFTVITGTSLSSGLGFEVSPGYISFQNGRFILACIGTQTWLLSEFNNGLSWPTSADVEQIGSLQTKPDTIQAAVPFPGRGNLLFVYGNNVVEPWVDVGAALFPYQKQASYNIDYGCLNASSIAALGNFTVWLGANEESGPVIMVSDGNSIQEISTDGLDFKFSQLTDSTDCSGFLVKLDGHLIYHFTFKTDNLTYLYDFESKLFFTASDENLNYHIARKIVFFNNQYYFVSYNDGNLYEFGTQFTNYQYATTDIRQIPRIRIMPPIRLPSQRYFIIKSIGFTIENGEPNSIQEFFFYFGNPILLAEENDVIIAEENNVLIALDQQTQSGLREFDITSEAVDLSISRDGAVNFGNQFRMNMNQTGNRKSRFIYQRLGQANDATVMLQFWGYGRFVVFDGVVEAYQ